MHRSCVEVQVVLANFVVDRYSACIFQSLLRLLGKEPRLLQTRILGHLTVFGRERHLSTICCRFTAKREDICAQLRVTGIILLRTAHHILVHFSQLLSGLRNTISFGTSRLLAARETHLIWTQPLFLLLVRLLQTGINHELFTIFAKVLNTVIKIVHDLRLTPFELISLNFKCISRILQ